MQQDAGSPVEKKEKGQSMGQRWEALQPTKTVLFWSCLGTAIITMILGFSWGGWMTAGAAESLSKKISEEALATRLAPLCVEQFQMDPAKAEKLEELKGKSSYSHGSYVMEQGWATISGDEKPDRKVAAECAKLIVLLPEIAPTTETTPAPAAESTPASE